MFSKELAYALSNDSAYLVTSIDAGYHENFQRIRNFKSWDRIWRNLQKYAEYNPLNVFIKYIIRDDNSSIDELKSFVSKVF